MFLVIAGFFRFWAGYSLGFLSGKFFEHRWPDYNTTYSFAGAFIVIGGGLPASVLGGLLSEHLESKIPSMKGLIAGLGALAATPFIFIAYVVQPSFWGSIVSYYIAYFIGEMWYGPSHAQINNMFPSEYQGFAVAVFNMFGSTAGALATLILSYMSQKYDGQKDHPDPTDQQKIDEAKIDGVILGWTVIASYCICGPLFIISGIKYGKQIQREKKQIASVVTSQIEAGQEYEESDREARGSLNNQARP